MDVIEFPKPQPDLGTPRFSGHQPWWHRDGLWWILPISTYDFNPADHEFDTYTPPSLTLHDRHPHRTPAISIR